MYVTINKISFPINYFYMVRAKIQNLHSVIRKSHPNFFYFTCKIAESTQIQENIDEIFEEIVSLHNSDNSGM